MSLQLWPPATKTNQAFEEIRPYKWHQTNNRQQTDPQKLLELETETTVFSISKWKPSLEILSVLKSWK
jgi:hypothetical protein